MEIVFADLSPDCRVTFQPPDGTVCAEHAWEKDDCTRASPVYRQGDLHDGFCRAQARWGHVSRGDVDSLDPQ